MKLATELERKINGWLTHREAQKLLADRSAYVNPDDSASNLGSQVLFTRLAVGSSIRSTASSREKGCA